MTLIKRLPPQHFDLLIMTDTGREAEGGLVGWGLGRALEAAAMPGLLAAMPGASFTLPCECKMQFVRSAGANFSS